MLWHCTGTAPALHRHCTCSVFELYLHVLELYLHVLALQLQCTCTLLALHLHCASTVLTLCLHCAWTLLALDAATPSTNGTAATPITATVSAASRPYSHSGNTDTATTYAHTTVTVTML